MRLAALLLIASCAWGEVRLSNNTTDSIDAAHTTTTFGTTNTTDASMEFFVALNGRFRARTASPLTRVRFYLRDATDVTAIYLSMRRYAGFGSVYSETTYQSVSFGTGLNSIALSPSLAAPTVGDYVTLRAEYNTPHTAVLNTFGCDNTAAGTTYYQYGGTLHADLNLAVMSTLATCAPAVEVWGDPPGLLSIGDSIIAYQSSFIDPAWDANPDFTYSSIGKTAAGILGRTYMNMGVGGQTSVQIAARFTTDAINEANCGGGIKTRLLHEGGINNVDGNPTQVIADATADMAAAQAAGCQMIMLLMTPCSSCSTGKMQDRDTANAAIAAAAPTYGHLVANAGTAVGQFRMGGDVGNLWDIQAAYDDGSGLHFNSAGAAVIGGVVANSIPGGGTVSGGKAAYGGKVTK